MADEQVVADSQTPDPGTTTPAKTGTDGKPVVTANPAPKPDATAGDADADKRFKGIQTDLQNERKARQQFQQQFNQVQGALASAQRQIQALTGTLPKSEADAEAEVVRDRLLKIFPALGKLDDEKLDRLLGIADQADSLTEATTNHWTNHGRQMLTSLTSKLSEVLGGKLTDRQANAIKRAYVQEAEANPEFLARHEQADPKLIEEFVQQWAEDWIDPARRIVTNQEVNRNRRVPNGRGGRDVTGGQPKKIDFKDTKAVEDALVASFKEHGGSFGD